MPESPPPTPLRDPGAYFRHDQQTALRDGLLVFVAYVAGLAVYLYIALSLVAARVVNAPPEFQEALQLVYGRVVFFLLLVAPVGLLVVAGIMHYAARDGLDAGSFGDTVAVAGWAYAPNLLSIPLTYIEFRQRMTQQTIHGSDPAVLEAQLEAARMGGTTGVSIAITLVVVAWSVYILGYGTAATHDADLDRTMIAAFLVGIGAFILAL